MTRAAPLALGAQHTNVSATHGDVMGMASMLAAAGPGMGSNALLAGLIYGGVHVIGPDHLGTLMTLSAAASRQGAFKVGAAWGLGHSFGMCLMGVVFVVFHGIVKFDIDAWEHVGDYIIGVSMILCALYFIVRESDFVEMQSDGSYVQKPCACHGGYGHHHSSVLRPEDLMVHECSPSMPQRSLHEPRRSRLGRRLGQGEKLCGNFTRCSGPGFCTDSSCADHADAECGACEECTESDCDEATDEEAESAPLVPKGASTSGRGYSSSSSAPLASGSGGSWLSQVCGSRDWKSGLLGVLQGVCCPMGIVGISFLAKMRIHEVAAFLVTFIFVSAFGTATLAMGWAHLTSRGIGVSVSPKTVYRSSCAFTLALGSLWIVANYTGALEKLDYTAAIPTPH